MPVISQQCILIASYRWRLARQKKIKQKVAAKQVNLGESSNMLSALQ